jgi:hypothetical protein
MAAKGGWGMSCHLRIIRKKSQDRYISHTNYVFHEKLRYELMQLYSAKTGNYQLVLLQVQYTELQIC